ncbi:MAG: hypothetical protein WCJ42_02530 [Actinomycetes bacterium]
MHIVLFARFLERPGVLATPSGLGAPPSVLQLLMACFGYTNSTGVAGEGEPKVEEVRDEPSRVRWERWRPLVFD